MNFSHQSVLLTETVEALCVKPEGTYVDGTLGGGGHAEAVLGKLNDQGRLIGIDQDEAAIKAAGERLKAFRGVTLIRSNYCYIRDELEHLGI
ncbi:MAG: 16S rRNA (cytosine(1402)-N(4))-methyltransferase, partial [Lachnospiraceae bacterium]|nr:16S rRNA (cytosine(1402)-N(4))-methyltransferase [Lachnospiraceae bacterium]